jgi:SAM-dependent methyltransferase
MEIERDQPFSKSTLWKWQKEAYLSLGPTSWSQGFVPSYITSNPFTARWMALLVVHYFKSRPINLEEPVTIIDLGAGSGRFSFLFLSYLKQLTDFKIAYVMTDISEDTIDSWKKHPQLAPFDIDFILFNHDDKILPFKKNSNPVILIANYFFNTIPCDLYRIKGGQVEEGRICLNVDPTKTAIEKIESFEIEETFYPLEKKFPFLGEGTFFYPTAALDLLHLFAEWSDEELLLISGDQGVSNLQQLSLWEPKICRHKTFSTAVNHLALAQFFEKRGGVAFLSKDPAYVFGVTVGLLGKGKEGIKECLESVCSFEPKDYYLLAEGWKGNFSSLLSLLKLGDGDPINMHFFFDNLREGIKTATVEEKEVLKTLIEKAVTHFFRLSEEETVVYINLGVLLFEAGFKTEAKTLFLKAKEVLGEDPLLEKNLYACS